MDTNKIIDDIVISMSFPHEEKSRICFIVFSSREPHTEIVIDCIEAVLGQEFKYEVIRLDKYISSGESQYTEINKIINECSIGVVILDGFRPNILFEYGILNGLKKPCIVLKENNATIDLVGLFKDVGIVKKFDNPIIDMDKQFSDVKDRYYVSYDKNNPKEIREKLKKEMSNLKQLIEDEYINMLIPNKEILIHEIKNKLARSFQIYEQKSNEISTELKSQYNILMIDIVDIARENKMILPAQFYIFIATFFKKLNDYDESLKWIDQCPEKTLNYYALKSSVLIRQKEYKKLLTLANEGLIKYNDKETIWHRKAIAHDRLGEEKEAYEAYNQGIKFNDGCSWIHYHYGISLYKQGKAEKALEQFNIAYNMRSSIPEYSIWIAKSLLVLGKPEEGLALFTKILKENPKYPEVWFERGRIELDEKKALKYINKSLKLKPNLISASCHKASILSKVGKTKQAFELIKEVEIGCSNYNTCTRIKVIKGYLLMKLKKYDKALEEIEKCDKKYKKSSSYHAFRAVHFVLTDEIELGYDMIERASKINAKNDSNYYNFACALSIKNVINKSLEYLKLAVNLNIRVKDRILIDPDLENLRKSVDVKGIFDI